MELIEYVKLFTAFIVSIGGASVVVVALAKWFGGFLSNRLLDSYNNKHERELETLKNKYANELEKTKAELEKTKAELEKTKLLFARYSEKQFDLYNDLWKVLLYTKQQADMLWEKAEPSQIPAFSEQIRLTRNAINENLLLIEDEHYKKLIKLIGQFEQFQFGKQKLIDIRAQGNDNMASQITKGEARETINQNRKTKENYDNLIMDIGKSFRTQIKG
jgi:Skp family chaperone for outer membrane proteins